MANTQAQMISDHQWKDRVLLLLTEDKENAEYKKQLEELRGNREGLKERKLVVYHLDPMDFRMGVEEPTPWHPATELYDKYKMTDTDFEVILIGLDGTVKLNRQEVLSTEELFKKIDSMPMRQEEMRKNDGD